MNMQTNTSFERDRFFVLKTSNKIEEFNSLQDCFVQSDIRVIIHDKFKCKFNYNSAYDKRLSDFIFYSNSNEEIKLIINNWTVEQIDTTSRLNKEIDFSVKFSDPLKRVKILCYSISAPEQRKSGINGHDLIIVQETLRHLEELSFFHNWEQYELTKENQKLKEEIESLKQQQTDNTEK